MLGFDKCQSRVKYRKSQIANCKLKKSNQQIANKKLKIANSRIRVANRKIGKLYETR